MSQVSAARAQTYADGSWHRLHPLTPVLRGGLAVAAIAGVILAGAWESVLNAISNYLVYREFPETEPQELPPLPVIGSLLLGLFVVGAIALIGALWLWLAWYLHTVRIDDDVIEVRDGVLFRTHRRARRDRINSVALWRPLIPRILGLAKLEFQAAGSDANVTLAYLRYDVAVQLRQIVVQDQQSTVGAEGGDAGGEASRGEDAGGERSGPQAEPNPILHVEVPLGRLFASLLVSLETAWFVLVFAAIITSWLITGEVEVWIAAFPAAVVYVLTIARGWTRASHFRLESVGDAVRVSYGLLSTTAASIPPDKVHALHISQPWPWRLFGWWRVEIHRAITPGQSSANQAPSHQMVMPVGHLEDVREVIALFAGYSVGESELDLLGEALRGPLPGPADDEDHAGEPRPVVLRPGPLARLRLILSWPIHSMGIIGDALWLRTGVLIRKLTIVPLRRVQSAAKYSGPWHLITGLEALEVNLVPGPGVTKLIGFYPDQADGFLEELSTRVITAISLPPPTKRRMSEQVSQ